MRRHVCQPLVVGVPVVIRVWGSSGQFLRPAALPLVVSYGDQLASIERIGQPQELNSFGGTC